MSYTAVLINGVDVTRFVTKMGELREWNDESMHFAGVFRRGNLSLELDNTSGLFNKEGSIFNGVRNEARVILTYHSSDSKINPYRVFSGVLDEGSTLNDLERKTAHFTILDYLKLLDSQVIRSGNQRAIDTLYKDLRGSGSSVLDKHFIACFLFYFLRGDSFKLNDIFNVFVGNELKIGSYPTINATTESIFSPSDNYYDLDNVSALKVLVELCKSINSYLYVETLEDRSQLYVKARPQAVQSEKVVSGYNILSFSEQTDGFNKLYNSITINHSRAYLRQSSIDKYGVRVKNISSYAPASATLADTYLDYYSEPKPEVTFVVKLRNAMLDIKVGDLIRVDLPSRPDLTVQGIKGRYFVIARAINFSKEVIKLRLRGV